MSNQKEHPGTGDQAAPRRWVPLEESTAQATSLREYRDFVQDNKISLPTAPSQALCVVLGIFMALALAGLLFLIRKIRRMFNEPTTPGSDKV